MKKFYCLIILLSCVLETFAAVTLGFPGEGSSYVGIYIKDLATGQVIEQNDADKAMMPASVMKAITAATALSTLPSDFRFATKVYLTDIVSNGICKGNLVIESCGDPTIDSSNFEDRKPICDEIADALISLGVSKITGKIIVKESLTQVGCIPEWEIDDVAWAYGAGLYGFNYKDNKFKLWPATGITEPHVPNLKLTMIPDSSNDLLRGIFSNNLHVYGPRLNDKNWCVNTTMDAPADVFAYALNECLTSRGISVGTRSGSGKMAVTPVCTHFSPSLTDILGQMLIHSHNLYAEGMLRTFAPDESRTQAIKNEMQIWHERGIYTGYQHVCDGSGLSRADRLRPTFIGDVLEWMARSEQAYLYASLFPKVGIDGTVKNFLKETNLHGQLALKTGSMNAVQCYAGYKLDEAGMPTHVVVILINSFFCDRPTLRSSIEKFLLKTL